MKKSNSGMTQKIVNSKKTGKAKTTTVMQTKATDRGIRMAQIAKATKKKSK